MWYLRMSVVYLVIGTTLGAYMGLGYAGILPGQDPSEGMVLVHVHLLLVGFVSMMIFGISYHVLPRFAGRGPDPYSPRAAVVQFWVLNAGLVAFAAGLWTGSAWAIATGGVLMLSGMYIYAWNVWRTLSAD